MKEVWSPASTQLTALSGSGNMPRLRQLTCTVEHHGSNIPFREYGTAYGDGVVETYIAVPPSSSRSRRFNIHLTSNGFDAPNVAMFVWIDGVYQCNRSRQVLVARDKDGRKQKELDLRVRQKEEIQMNGQLIGRDWAFERINTGVFTPIHVKRTWRLLLTARISELDKVGPYARQSGW